MPAIRLIISDPQADFLADALEEQIQSAHEDTCEFPAGTPEFDAAIDEIKALGAILRQFDPENPIFQADAEPGLAFDWDGFWTAAEADDDQPDDEEDESGEISVARKPNLRVIG